MRKVEKRVDADIVVHVAIPKRTVKRLAQAAEVRCATRAELPI
jgi:hypothetical protein